MVRDGQDGNILRPEGNGQQAELLGERHCPTEESVRYDAGDGRYIGLMMEIVYELLHMGFHVIQRLIKLVDLIPSLKLAGHAIGYGHQPNIEAKSSSVGERIHTGAPIGLSDDFMP